MNAFASKGDEFEPLRRFIDFYDYSFWHYKVKTLNVAIKDDEFINKIANTFPVGGDPEKIRKALAAEIYFTCLHAIEALFFLIGGFTYKPNDPLEWINNPEQHVNKIAGICKKKKFKELYEKLGVKNLDDYLYYLFFPVNSKFKKEFVSSIKTLPELLYLLAEEFFSKKEAYNSYKHGLLIFRGDLRLLKGDKSGKETTLIEALPVFMVSPKDGKKKSKFVPQLEGMVYESDFMAKLDFYPLNYLRQLDIFGLTMALIRNLIQIRRDIIKKSSDLLVLNLPPLEDIKRVFEEPPLFTMEKIEDSKEEGKNE